MGIKAVLFDLDETIVDRPRMLRAFLRDQHSRSEVLSAKVAQDAFVETYVGLDDNGRRPRAAIYGELRELLDLDGSIVRELLERHSLLYPTFALATVGSIEFIRKLVSQGKLVGVITNGNRDSQRAKLRTLGIEDELHALVISEEVGLRKPSPSIFLLALSTLATEAASAIFVGDDPRADIVGAAAAGMKTAWMRNGRTWPSSVSPRADHEIDAVGELSFLL